MLCLSATAVALRARRNSVVYDASHAVLPARRRRGGLPINTNNTTPQAARVDEQRMAAIRGRRVARRRRGL